MLEMNREEYKVTRRFIPFAILLTLLSTSGASIAAESPESKIAALEETVRSLERRVASLEAQLRERTPSTNVALDKANWRKLQKRLSEAEVEKLLGTPTRVDTFASFTVWNYGSGGSVEFDGDTRKVTSWHEPR